MERQALPKILVVTRTRVNAHDAESSSLLLKNIFRRWPRDRVAQIYTGGSTGDAGYWGGYYEVGRKDRRFGRFFFGRKGAELTKIAGAAERGHIRSGFRAWISRFLRKVLIAGGLYELVFALRVSEDMMRFIERFAPDVIYAQGYCYGLAWLPVAIQKRIRKPICFYTSDDWPEYTYAKTPFSWIMHPLLLRMTRTLIRRSALCFGFSPDMCADYGARYGKHFHLLMNGDDFERFVFAHPEEPARRDVIRVVYAGRVAQGRWESLLDLCVAVLLLRKRGIACEVYAYLTDLSPGLVRRFGQYDFFFTPDHPSHEELPARLKEADILFLPESFEEEEARAIRYSISTKAQLYMMSERPIIVYAHPLSGICRYAESEGWALVVRKRSACALADSLRTLVESPETREAYRRRGREVALANHDIGKNADRFAEMVESLWIGNGERVNEEKRTNGGSQWTRRIGKAGIGQADGVL